MISTVEDLIKALGGTDSAAGAFVVGKNALSNWKVANDLPAWARIEAKRLADAAGLTLHPDLIGRKRRAVYGSLKAAREAAKKRRQAHARMRMKTKARRVFASAAE